MTHEYVIGIGGRVLGADSENGPAPTAIAWAVDAVLAVGSDEVVGAISRGDSTFVDLDGCTVTAPGRGTVLEPGAPADLDFWTEPRGADGDRRRIAGVRAGAFTEGDEHCGPFRRATVRG